MFNPQRISKLIDERKLLERRFTKVELLKAIDLSAPSLQNILNGKSLPRIDTLETIANFFNVDMNYFFDQYESKPIPGSYINEPSAEYSKENPWKLCFELQKEITELRVELERCEKFSDAPNAITKTG